MATVISSKHLQIILYHMIDSMVMAEVLTPKEAGTAISAYDIFYDIVDKANRDGNLMALYIEARESRNVARIVESLKKDDEKTAKSGSEMALDELVRALLKRKK